MRAMFESNDFGLVAREVVAHLERYLGAVKAAPARPYTKAADMIARARQLMDAPPVRGDDLKRRAAEISQVFLESAHRLHSKKSMGHQVVPGIPEAAAFEMLGSITNSSGGIFEMGPFVTAIERATILKLLPLAGFSNGDGIATHGGSLANLTALVAARNLNRKGTWTDGNQRSQGNQQNLAVVTGADTHYSVSRAAAIVGVGTNNVIKAPLDSRRKVDCERLRELLKNTPDRDIFALIGSACATPIGAFDDLAGLASIAKEFGLWFHVDGAHGASLLLSKKHRHLLNGVEHADTLTWDAHKMMFVPSLCTFLLYKDKASSFEVFSQDAPYLLASEDPLEVDCDSARRAIECTKRPLSVATWALWSIYGESYFAGLIEKTIATARKLYELLSESEDFAALHEPECNIVCFRYEPTRLRDRSEAERSDYQSEIRKRLLERGEYYITGTRLDDMYALRVTVMNPETGVAELQGLLNHIREIAP